MAKPAERAGRGPCPHCGQPVLFKLSSGGKLTFTCDADECDSSGYAEPGGAKFKQWMASIKKPAADDTAPAPAKPPPPASGGFSLGQL